MRILVVDDHAATRRLLERNLEAAPHGVKLAGSCAQATSAVAVGAFDVIVLDVMLPDGSGMELCSELRAAKATTPILLLTARGEVRDRVRGLDAEAIVHDAFHSVSFLDGGVSDVPELVARDP